MIRVIDLMKNNIYYKKDDFSFYCNKKGIGGTFKAIMFKLIECSVCKKKLNKDKFSVRLTKNHKIYNICKNCYLNKN